MNIVLFGFMGVGKSEVGRILAQRLGLRFSDIDMEVSKAAGKPIHVIFEKEGEEVFRMFERKAVEQASEKNGQVIACGGGTILDHENVARLRSSSLMVLLTAHPEIILERVGRNGGSRPLLNVEDKQARIRSLLSARYGKYLEAADMVIDTSKRSPEQVAEEILKMMKGECKDGRNRQEKHN